MQSGISVSPELHSAFRQLLTDPSQRGLLVTIRSETLVPHATVPSTTTSFFDDLGGLAPHIKPDEAAYVLLRRTDGTPAASSAATLVAVTKTLFASTRLSLVRDLGPSHFAGSVFATEPAELTPDGFRALEAHDAAEAPLTREEQDSQDLREAEAVEGGTYGTAAGTGGRRGHVHGRIEIPLGPGVEEALERLKGGADGDLVQLKWDVPNETVVLANPGEGCEQADAASLAGKVSTEEPRYSFFRYREGGGDGQVAFVYTCPTNSRVKDRMLYATGSRGVASLADSAGIEIAKRIEFTDPSDISPQSLAEELAPKRPTGGAGEDGGGASLGGERRAFAKPKRPGRR